MSDRPRKTAKSTKPTRGRPTRRASTKTRTKRPIPAEPVSSVGERVLGLDVSSKCVGWALFVDGALSQHGRYALPGTAGYHGEKLRAYRRWLTQLLVDFQPTHLIYEAPYSGRMRSTFGVLSRYAGVTEAVHFAHFGVELPHEHAVAAHLVKKAIGARKGTSHEQNKKIVLLLVNETYGLSLKYKANDPLKRVSQDDEADAIALVWAWHRLYRPED